MTSIEQLVALDLIHESSSCCDQGAPTPDDHSVGGKDGAGAVSLPAAPADPSDALADLRERIANLGGAA